MDRIGASDCEAFSAGWLAQPANAISSLAFVAAGLWLLRPGAPAAHRLLGLAALAVGAGSFLFHGPQPVGARLVHDVALLAVAGAIAAAPSGRPRAVGMGMTTFAVFGAAVLGTFPSFGTAAVAGAGAIAALAVARRGSVLLTGLRARAGMAVMVLAGLALVLGRTGAAWCRPDSAIQAHSVWHVLAAAGLVLLAPALTGNVHRRRSPT